MRGRYLSVRGKNTQDSGGKTVSLYWAGGSLLPKEELANSKNYWTLLYSYAKELADPADFSKAEIERIKGFSSTQNRREGAGTPLFFFDALYSSSSRASVESHLKRINFLGRNTTVHERIVAPLKKVEQRINAEAKNNSTVKNFISEIFRFPNPDFFTEIYFNWTGINYGIWCETIIQSCKINKRLNNRSALSLCGHSSIKFAFIKRVTTLHR